MSQRHDPIESHRRGVLERQQLVIERQNPRPVRVVEMISKQRLIASANLPPNKGVTIRTGPLVTDGPYSEAKEAVTGLLLIAASDEAEARTIASECPFLSRGGSVELRPIAQLEFEDAAGPLVDTQAAARRNAKAGEV